MLSMGFLSLEEDRQVDAKQENAPEAYERTDP
jgi:hypothetical protein